MSEVWWRVKKWVLSSLPYPESVMRKKEDILRDGTRKEDLIIEILLDLRDLLEKQGKVKKIVKKVKKKQGMSK